MTGTINMSQFGIRCATSIATPVLHTDDPRHGHLPEVHPADGLQAFELLGAELQMEKPPSWGLSIVTAGKPQLFHLHINVHAVPFHSSNRSWSAELDGQKQPGKVGEAGDPALLVVVIHQASIKEVAHVLRNRTVLLNRLQAEAAQFQHRVKEDISSIDREEFMNLLRITIEIVDQDSETFIHDLANKAKMQAQLPLFFHFELSNCLASLEPQKDKSPFAVYNTSNSEDSWVARLGQRSGNQACCDRIERF
ncbi:hypothetical protein SELMODRAFT_431566 [Selaginella moellendorffii]|uniref:Uncharacterized protein n=1 Tax=Selaginella moellendorffii TaxID=88036 RepID=D8TD27_SELML|nr:hypothetical protein SELMODRAFT_431566 [Selaginella moellendorffii]